MDELRTVTVFDRPLGLRPAEHSFHKTSREVRFVTTGPWEDARNNLRAVACPRTKIATWTEHSMNQPSSQYSNDNDEISLVDLAKILVKRWKAMAIIFGVIVLASLAYALLMPRTYNYTSIYEVAEQGPGNALEAPKALVAKANNLYLGPETRELLSNAELANLPFDIKIENPEETLLVSLTSQATQSNVDIVTQLHEGVLARLQEGQQAMVTRRKESLERQLENARASLEVAKQSEGMGAAEVVASIMGRTAALEADLTELNEGEVSQTAVQSLESTGTGGVLILALGIVIGGMLAIMGAFFMQFAGLVCYSLKQDA